MGARRLGDRTRRGAWTAGRRTRPCRRSHRRRSRGRRGHDGGSGARNFRTTRRGRTHARRAGAGRCTGGGRGGRRRSAAAVRRLEGTTKPPGHGGLDGAGSGFDELAHFLELGENGLAVDPELLCELVYAGLAWHCTPHFEVVRAEPAATSLVH
jgi:hypothetical protein